MRSLQESYDSREGKMTKTIRKCLELMESINRK